MPNYRNRVKVSLAPDSSVKKCWWQVSDVFKCRDRGDYIVETTTYKPLVSCGSHLSQGVDLFLREKS